MYNAYAIYNNKKEGIKMKCPECNTINESKSKYCSTCGIELEVEQTEPKSVVEKTIKAPQMKVVKENLQKLSNKINIKKMFITVIATMIKPFTAMKKELNKYNDIKQSGILALIMTIIFTLISLIKSMIDAIIVKNYNWAGEVTETNIVFERLGDVEYFQVLGKSFITILGTVLLVAGAYYIIGLIIKKQTNFSRLLTISAISLVPVAICSMIISPILSLIYAQLGVATTMIGSIYSFLIIYENINEELKLKEDNKYYINLIALSIIGIITLFF